MSSFSSQEATLIESDSPLIVVCGIDKTEVTISEQVWKSIPYFKSMISSGMVESATRRLQFDVEESTLQGLLNIITTLKSLLLDFEKKRLKSWRIKFFRF